MAKRNSTKSKSQQKREDIVKNDQTGHTSEEEAAKLQAQGVPQDSDREIKPEGGDARVVVVDDTEAKKAAGVK